MKDIAGGPATVTGLVLRIGQCCFAAGSLASMATTRNFFSITAFCYLIASMSLQVIWSFTLASLDAYALAKRKVLRNHLLMSLFVVGDWVTATLTLAAATSAAGVTVLIINDMGDCNLHSECIKIQLAVAFAFLSWTTIASSCLIMLWLVASG